MLYILNILFSYLIGSIPTAYILVKLIKRQDIRDIGSGNVGATNAGRALGTLGYVLVLVFDVLKGFIPVWISTKIGNSFSVSEYFPLITGFFLVIGHVFTIFLGFKGGKGVATGLGIFLCLAPIAVLGALLTFLAFFLAIKIVSICSIISSLVLGILVVVLYDSHALWYFTFITVSFIILAHRANIVRILHGDEPKFTAKQ